MQNLMIFLILPHLIIQTFDYDIITEQNLVILNSELFLKSQHSIYSKYEVVK